VAETTLVTGLLAQGLSAIEHPGVVFRPGPSGWRAGLAGGPDVDEVIRALRASGATGENAVAAAAADLGIDTRFVHIAVDYAAENIDEIEARLLANETALERVRRLTAARATVLAE